MAQKTLISFGEFRFDPTNECLWRGSEAIALRPKAFAVLKYLIAHAGQLVVKQALIDAVWAETFVGDAVLKDSVRQLRDALGDDATTPRYIETAHRRGYRFIAAIREDGQTPPAAATTAAPPPLIAPLTPPASTRSTGPVLGRDDSLGQLEAWLARTLQPDRSERQIVFVTGEPGIGKTTVVESFLARAAATHRLLTTRGQCLEQYGSGEAYLPVLDALTRLCRGADGARIVDLLRQHAPTWLAQLPSLVPMDQRDALRQEAAAATRERMLREIAETLETLTADTPLILVLEDLHWSDYSTLDLISYVARRRDPARLMVIGTYRPVDLILSDHPLKSVKRELQVHGLCHELPLEYLSEKVVDEYLDLRFPDHAFPALLTRMIHGRTEGNPLFMLTVVSYLQDEEIIVERDGRWRLSGTLVDVAFGVPENLRQLIDKQIERLAPDEQRVLEGASVVGMDCSTVAIAAGLDEDPGWVEARCEELVRRHRFLLPARLVELPDGTLTPRYQFVHVLYRDVPYERIPVMRRAGIHRRISQAGEAIYGDRVSEIAGELAMHFEQARVWPRAAHYLQIASENAAHRYAHHEAAALARRGLDALGQLPADAERRQREIALRITLGSSLMATRGFADPEAEAVYSAALALCEGAGASEEQFTIAWSLGLLYHFRAEMRKAFTLAEQLMTLATTLQNPALLMEAHRALGVVYVERAEFANARKHLDQAMSLYLQTRQHPHMLLTAHDTLVVSDCYSARALWCQGHGEEALARVGAAYRVAAKHTHTESQVLAAYFGAHLHQLQGDAAATRDRADTLIGLAEDYGLELWRIFGVIHRGWAMAGMGEADAGIDHLRRGLAAYDATGTKLWRPHFQGMLADALGKGGRVDEALETITQAVNAAEETGELFSQPELHRLHGELLLARAPSATAEATASFERALASARDQQAVAWEQRIQQSLMRIGATRMPSPSEPARMKTDYV